MGGNTLEHWQQYLMAHSPVWCLCLSPWVSRNTFEYGLSEFLVCLPMWLLVSVCNNVISDLPRSCRVRVTVRTS